MPPRISDFPCLQALKSALPAANGRKVASPLRTFSSSASHQAKGGKSGKPNGYRDPYVVAQARARKAANASKQETLKINRTRALGDPIRGIETDFVKSFDTARDNSTQVQSPLNHFLTQNEVDAQLLKSKNLVEPAEPTERDLQHLSSNARAQGVARKIAENKHAQNKQQWEEAHDTVQEAVRRITNIDNGNAKDRFRINVERCIQTFGRHETDKVLPRRQLAVPLGPGALPLSDHTPEEVPLKQRLGPDTGSSEVQIAILTAKIRNMVRHMAQVGKHDKVNKRNLRLLVHRRQKLLLYLRRKERAGPRWQKCIETLGLTEGTWRGEITM